MKASQAFDSQASDSPFARIEAFYNGRVDQYGHDPRACDYGRPESQTIKFRVLSEVGSLTGKSILDIGCGFADYAEYLEERFPAVRYTGVDLSPRMIEEARRLRPGLDLRVWNPVERPLGARFDVVTANGIFYLLGPNADDLMRDLINTMYSLAETSVAFNSLSSWAESPEPGEYYADPSRIIDFCRSITPWIVCRHDYHPRDFTMYMYKRRPV